MKTTFKQFNFLFFILFAIVIAGCGKDDQSEISDLSSYKEKKLNDVQCLGYFDEGGDTINFSGLKGGHLWFRLVHKKTFKTIMEWEDTEVTSLYQTIDTGNGETSFTIDIIKPQSLFINGSNFVAGFKVQDIKGYVKLYAVFSSIGQISSKKIVIVKPFAQLPKIRRWYNGSVIIDFSCYSERGEILYTSNHLGGGERHLVPISYDEVISITTNASQGTNILNIGKVNYRTGHIAWLEKVTIPFSEDSQTSSYYKIYLLDKSTNIWKYKVDIVYYDGTKKDFMFTVNVNDGKVSIL